jgi:hypothetical protein
VNKAVQRICFALAFIALMGGIARFAYLRFQSGDVYPGYSTLRSDPLGAKVVFESFKRLQATRTHRNVQSLERLRAANETTIFLLGTRSFMSGDEERRLTDFAHDGGRVVVALDARDSQSSITSPRRAPAVLPKVGTNAPVITPVTLTNLFGLDVVVTDRKQGTNLVDAERTFENLSLPERIPWFGCYSFFGATNNWQTIYSLKGQPVVVQKKQVLVRLC